MKLLQISYQDTNWELKGLNLESLNLLVGKNATGKSRVLSMVDLLYKMLTQKRDLNWGGLWNVKFENSKSEIITYNFSTSIKYKGVTFEEILVDDVRVVFRDKKKEEPARIKNFLENKFEEIHPPDNKLILHINRDVKKYPYLEDISSWAEQSFGFKFGNISPYAFFAQQEYDLLTAVEDIPQLYKSLNQTGKNTVLKEFNSLGYGIEEISIRDNKEFVVLYVKEAGLSKSIPHYSLSQGMFRSLAILIFIEYIITRKRPMTVIIDDLCEGLDYERATKLGKTIFSKCEEYEVQLIATSNDYFLMDSVDIRYWNVLRREGKVVTSLTEKLYPDLFQNFRFTGLSNFDFFASDYVSQNLDK